MFFELPLPTPGCTAIYMLGHTMRVYGTIDADGGYVLRCGKVFKNAMDAAELRTFLSSINASFDGLQ